MKGSHPRPADRCPLVLRHSISQVTSFMQLRNVVGYSQCIVSYAPFYVCNERSAMTSIKDFKVKKSESKIIDDSFYSSSL